MKVIGVDGKAYAWRLTGNNPSTNPSAPHQEARNLLKKLYPLEFVLEELSLPSTDLRCDFFIPGIRLMVEVQGEQHYKYIPHFHGDKIGFFKAQARDRLKRQWCALNNIRLVELRDGDGANWAGQLYREQTEGDAREVTPV